MQNYLHLIIVFITGILPLTLPAQTTEELFTRKGLSINAYYEDDVGSTANASYTYNGKTTYLGHKAHEYISNAWSLYLHFDNQKVFRIQRDSSLEMLYDFGMTVGDSINTSLYKGYVLREIVDIELLNGEKRRKFNFAVDTTDFIIKSWVEGIGDIQRGLVPCCPFEAATQFVCAKINDEMLLEGNRSDELCDSLSCIHPRGNFEIEQNDLFISIKAEYEYYKDILWDFGDGSTSSELNPTHKYTEPGCYKLSYQISPLCNDRTFGSSKELSICIKSPWQVDENLSQNGGGTISFLNENFGFLYRADSLFRTVDGGANWEQIQIEHDENTYIVDVEIYDTKKCIATIRSRRDYYDFQILTSNDGGLSWTKVITNINDKISGNLSIDKKTGLTFINAQFYLWKSIDYGQNWEEIDKPFKEVVQITCLDEVIYATGNEALYPNGKTSFYKSTNKGETWTKLAEDVDFHHFNFYDNNLGIAYGGYGGYDRIYKTEDGGNTWIDLKYNRLIKSIGFLDDQTFFMNDWSNIYKTTDQGNNFVKETCSDNLHFINHLYAFNENAIFGSTYFGVIKYGKPEIGCQPNQNDDLINVHFSISPNPASNSIEIKSDSEIKKIEIINIQGQIIKKLANRSSSIDISNLENGMYLLKIQDQNGLSGIQKFIKTKL